MTSTVFSHGSTIASSWLNDVNTIAYGIPLSTGSSLIGFLQSGTGAIARTAQAKLRDVVSVFDFMTTSQIADVQAGTASVDVSSAVQSAINSLTKGGILFFPSGVYRLASQINIPANLPFHLLGSGNYPTDSSAGPPNAPTVGSSTELRSVLRDGVTSAIKCGTIGTNDYSVVVFENMRISGGTSTEVNNGGTNGGTLGNFVGLYIAYRHHCILRNVHIAGFDTAGLIIDTCFYHGIYSCQFKFNGIGAKDMNGNAVNGFYNCHFQYNIYGCQDVTATFNCAWEGQGRSGAKYTTVTQGSVSFFRPYFEGNNQSNIAGEADIFADPTTGPQGIAIHDGQFISGSAYSAKPAATHHFNGRCTRFYLLGSTSYTAASPQNYPLFKLTGSPATFIDHVNPLFATNYTSGAFFKDMTDSSKDITLSTSTLTHFGSHKVRLSAGGAINLDNIDSGYAGMDLTLFFLDANITVRTVGNIKTSAAFTSTADDIMCLTYDLSTGKWKETSRSVN